MGIAVETAHIVILAAHDHIRHPVVGDVVDIAYGLGAVVEGARNQVIPEHLAHGPVLLQAGAFQRHREGRVGGIVGGELHGPFVKDRDHGVEPHAHQDRVEGCDLDGEAHILEDIEFRYGGGDAADLEHLVAQVAHREEPAGVGVFPHQPVVVARGPGYR